MSRLPAYEEAILGMLSPLPHHNENCEGLKGLYRCSCSEKNEIEAL